MGISIAGISVHKLCTVAMGSVFENMSTGTPDVKLIFNPSDKADIVINTDSKRVVQILMNLLSNASKFTERGRFMAARLYIPRLLARLLNGDLAVDPSYREGARFLLVIPM